MELTVIWCFVLNTRELIHTSVTRQVGGGGSGKTMLKILGVTIPNLVVWAAWHLGFVHPRIFVYNVQVSCFIHMMYTQLITQQDTNVTLLLTYIYLDLECE